MVLGQAAASAASHGRVMSTASPTPAVGDGVLVLANLELKPELSQNANVGPELSLKRTPLGAFSLTVNGFYRSAKNLMVLLGNDRWLSQQNVYAMRSYGAENTAKWSSP